MIALILIAAIAVLGIAGTEAGPIDTVSGGGTINILNLGTVDGKSYFVDPTRRDWFSAKAFCETQGLKLATIKTQREVDFLNSSYNSSTFSGLCFDNRNTVYWVAARDAQQKRALSWDDTGDEPEDFDDIYFGRGPLDYQLCGAYHSGTSNNYIDIHKCDGSTYNVPALCET